VAGRHPSHLQTQGSGLAESASSPSISVDHELEILDVLHAGAGNPLGQLVPLAADAGRGARRRL
jgi:hypothetical protein